MVERRVLRAIRAIGCVGVLASLLAPATASAKVELRVAPTIMRLEADAGDVLTEPISVTAVDDAMVVELVHADFGFDDANYQVTLIEDDAPETTAFSTRGWFSLPKERYRVPSGETIELPLRIEVPENTPAGTYLGAAFVRVVPAEARPDASQVQAVPRTGPLLFIAVDGGSPPEAKLRRFDVPGLVSEGPIRPDIVVENRGDEYFTYEGTVTLSGPGKDDSVAVSQQFVVPGQPRRLRTSPDAEGDEARPTLGKRELGFGRYEVRTRLRIEPTGKTLVSTRTLWVIPTWVRMLAAILALVFAISMALVVRWVLEQRRLAPFLEAELSRSEDDDLDADDDLASDEEFVTQEDELVEADELEEDDEPFVR